MEIDPLEQRRLEKLKSSEESSKLKPVSVIFVPAPNHPSHCETFFGKPFEISLMPMVPTKLPGKIAKLLACEFPKLIFMDDGKGNPVPFPSSKLNPKHDKGAPKK